MRTGLFSSSKPSSPARNSESGATSSTSSPSRTRHTFSEQMMEENIENAGEVIARWEIDTGGLNLHSNFNTSSAMFRDYPDEAKQLLRAVQDLQTAMHYLIKLNSSSESLVRAQNLMGLAMRRLEKEFHSTLSRNRTILDPESVSSRSPKASTRASSVSDEDEESAETDEEEDGNRYSNKTVIMEDLKSIAECMIASGYGKECISIYKLVRKSIVDESLHNLGLLEKLPNSSQIQKLEWDSLEPRIRNWLTGIKIAMKSIFLGERILCDYVFSSSEKVIESCFTDVVRDRALVLLSFPEIVAKSKRLSAEKMFRILDLYEAISALWPEIEVIFAFDSFSAVRSQAVSSLVKLGDAVRSMLSEFESAIQKDTSKAVPGGGIHPLTRYVMNYLAFLTDYSDSLADIVADWPLPLNSPLPEAYLSTPSSPSALDDDGVSSSGEDSPLAARLAWLILVLVCKLDAKAELYKDVALAYLFLANNLNYIVSKTRNSNLGPILGSYWILKHEAKVKQYTSNYERMGWSKVLTSFPEKPTVEISLEYVKECFKRFNSGFQEAYRTQSSWVIPDQKLREQVKLSLAKKLVPKYREFYENYRGTLRQDFGVLEPIVRFAPDDLGNYLSDLFHGNGVSGSTTSYESPSPSNSPRMSTS